MAGKKYTIEIDADVQELKTSVNKANESLEKLEKQGKQVANATDKIGDSAKQTASSVRQIGRAFTTVGVAVRTVLASGMLKLVDASIEFFSQLQPVLDLVNGINNSLAFAVKNIDELATGTLTLSEYWDGIKTTFSELTQLQKDAILNEARLAGLQQETAANMSLLMVNLQDINLSLSERLDLIDTAAEKEQELYESQKANVNTQLDAIALQLRGDEKNIELLTQQIQLENELLAVENEHKINQSDINNLRKEANLQNIEMGENMMAFDIWVNDNDLLRRKSYLERLDTELAATQYHISELEKLGLQQTETYKNLKMREVEITQTAEQAKTEAIVTGVTAGLSAIAAGLTIAEQMAKGDFEKQKKIRIANVITQGLMGLVGAWAGAFMTPVPTPAQLILAGISSAIMAGVTAYNVSQIAKQQPDGGGGGGAYSATGGGGGGAPTAAPSFSLINPLDAGGQAISQQMSEQASDPMKAYVVTQDVSSGQQLDRQIAANATI